MNAFDVAVVGQGYAGLCAARAARHRGLSVAGFEGVMVGGAVMTVLRLEPSPEDFTISGPDLGAEIGMQNIDEGLVPFLDKVTGIEPAPGGWIVRFAKRAVAARHVILATGTKPLVLNVPGEAAFADRGVSRCADCDGPEMVGKDCVVVGGGDSAFQEAAILARVAKSVTVVLRGDTPRARPDLVARAQALGVAVLRNCRVTEIIGDDRVTGARLDNGDVLGCQGLFVFIGGRATLPLIAAKIARDAKGAIVTGTAGALDLPGLWAVGSVRSGFSGGLAEAGADACRAVAALPR